jgi:outer membrane protein assembly factor BamE (lipoprotein component of BamABCDE complex)
MKSRVIRSTLFLLLSALLLAACATAGRQFDRTHVNDVKKGVQTKEQIRAWFGEPYQVTAPLSGHPAGCVERWTYVHAYASYGGMKSTSASLVVDFDKKGKVCDHAYSETK